MNAAALAIAACAAIVAPAGAAAPSARVIGGAEAPTGSFPYLAWIHYYNGPDDGINGRVCTGTVVASNVVLTAAHCLINPGYGPPLDPAHFTVVTGNVHHLAEPHSVSAVTKLATAPNFRTEAGSPTPLAGDAGVLVLARPTSAPPVRLATVKEWGEGTAVTFAGWGETGTADAGDGLRFGTSSVQSDSYCASKTDHYDPAEWICSLDTPDLHDSICHGDSGGPLLMTPAGTAEPVEIGVSSFGSGECSPERPAYFTRVDNDAAWVTAVIAANPPTYPPAPAPPVDLTPREPRPLVSAAMARSKATAALRRGLGARFAGRRGYKVACNEVNVHKQECRVSWKTADTRYHGTVTVFGLHVGGKVVWHTPYVVQATTCGARKVPRARPACQVRTLRG